MLDLLETGNECYRIAKKRAAKDKHYNMTQNIKNLAGEVVELEEAITQLTMTTNEMAAEDKLGSTRPSLDNLEKFADLKEAAEDELADVVIYSLLIANQYYFNLEAAISRKIRINRERAEKED